MKKLLTCIVFLCSLTIYSQTYFGDVNHDGKVNVADVAETANIAIGKSKAEKISVLDPYYVCNDRIIGTWFGSKTHLIFREDGTTFYNNAERYYKFFPNLGRILFYTSKSAKSASLVAEVYDIGKDYILIGSTMDVYTSYRPNQKVTGLTINTNVKEMNVGESIELSYTITPSYAENKNVSISSTDNSILSYANGYITANKAGTATINIETTDGSELSASLTIIVTKSQTYTINGIEYPMPELIDLGLPSGTLWANMNIGSKYDHDFGFEFEWGNPYYPNDTSKKQVTWNPFYDTNNYAGTEYDAATHYLGEGWSTPTVEQFNELITYAGVYNTHQNNDIEYIYTFGDIHSDKFVFIPGCSKHEGDSWLLTSSPKDYLRTDFGNAYNYCSTRFESCISNIGGIRPVYKK